MILLILQIRAWNTHKVWKVQIIFQVKTHSRSLKNFLSSKSQMYQNKQNRASYTKNKQDLTQNIVKSFIKSKMLWSNKKLRKYKKSKLEKRFWLLSRRILSQKMLVQMLSLQSVPLEDVKILFKRSFIFMNNQNNNQTII